MTAGSAASSHSTTTSVTNTSERNGPLRHAGETGPANASAQAPASHGRTGVSAITASMNPADATSTHARPAP